MAESIRRAAIADTHPPETVRALFADSSDRMCMRPLSHVTLSWELTWDADTHRYDHEDERFAEEMNDVIA